MTNQTMRAVVADEPGGPEVLHLKTVPIPQPGPGEVRIKVAYCGLNPMDAFGRGGVLTWMNLPWPFTPGIEHAGIVDAVGDGVEASLIGSRVHARNAWGGNADYSISQAANLLPMAEGLDWKVGSVYRGMTFTAWHCLHTAARVRQGDVCVFHSAAGPVAIMLTQVAKDAGATVIGLVGSAAKIDYARPFGADHLVDYVASDWVAEVMRITDGHGADIIVDGNQGPDAPKNYEAAAANAKVIYIGATAGAPAPDVPTFILIGKSIFVGGFNLPLLEAAGQDASDEVIDKVRTGAWKIPIGEEVELEDVPELHARFHRRELVGRVIIRVGGEL
jgi:NADPH2:quinone reductase